LTIRRRKKPRTVIIPDWRRSAWLQRFFGSRFGKVLLPLLVFLLPLGMAYSSAAASKPKKQSDKPYALIYGTVWGPDQHALYGVRVRIRRADQHKPHWELYSDHEGEFAQRVPAGKADYVVWPDLKGYKSSSASPLRAGDPVAVHIDNDERQDIGLHLK
jgi:hypothetical protein